MDGKCFGTLSSLHERHAMDILKKTKEKSINRRIKEKKRALEGNFSPIKWWYWDDIET